MPWAENPGKNVLKINIDKLLILTNAFTVAHKRLAEIYQITFVISSHLISAFHIKNSITSLQASKVFWRLS